MEIGSLNLDNIPVMFFATSNSEFLRISLDLQKRSATIVRRNFLGELKYHD